MYVTELVPNQVKVCDFCAAKEIVQGSFDSIVLMPQDMKGNRNSVQ